MIFYCRQSLPCPSLLDTNDCYPNPCLNDGLCTDGVNDYNCTCVPGFVGKNCNCKFKNIKPQYLYQFLRFTCAWFSNLCFSLDTDDCYPNPCLNNGTCVDGVNDYNCTCVPGFVGKNCNCKFKNIKPQYLYQFVRFTCTCHLNGFQISVSPETLTAVIQTRVLTVEHALTE